MNTPFAIIGFGEAAQTFSGGAGWRNCAHVYDRKTDVPETAAQKTADYNTFGVTPCTTNTTAVSGAPYIMSLVTADQSLAVAEETSNGIEKSAIFFDMNSVAPGTKRNSANAIESAGGRYLDVAIMAPVQPKALNVPLLVAGPVADEGVEILKSLGFANVRSVGAEVGQASTIKMLRSIMIKGIEALTAECVLAASKADALDAVLAALGDDWADRANYNLDRMMIHGTRRAAEMEEVVKTIEDLGMNASMTAGTVARQSAIGALNFKTPPDSLQDKLALLTGKESIK
ncbi:MAG: 6-phosphogluconate dehydrogenase [Ponticaulis sp.]|nr:6-phosphogluconate dehydrogenase [Ponticaulis sp.]|tara:strand:- start:29743 stop:30603 length:861 start_codon:yes stop_codon:yes gene_type:complete